MEGLEGGTEGKGIARGIGVEEIGERVLMARAGIKEAMGSKDTDREENIGDEKEVTRGEERIDIEGTESDTKIVAELREGDGEIEIITESTKIGEERGVEIGNGEEGKGKATGRTGEECGRDSTGSSAWPWLVFGKFTASSLMAYGDTEFLCNLIFHLSFLMERLSLR